MALLVLRKKLIERLVGFVGFVGFVGRRCCRDAFVRHERVRDLFVMKEYQLG
jgi:hypothetical protein